MNTPALRCLSLLVMPIILASGFGGSSAFAQSADDDDRGPTIEVARLTYAGDRPTACFSGAFLTLADHRSTLRVDRAWHEASLGHSTLFEHPLAVMSGDQAFELPAAEVERLREYLTGGGFLLASASCSSRDWDASFRRALERALPDHKLERLPADHPLLHTLYDVKRVVTVKPHDAPLWGLTLHGRLVVLYSPVGLNDSAQMGPDCCCCGANEIRNARYINANALVYAVTH
jgi:hypothetical protein